MYDIDYHKKVIKFLAKQDIEFIKKILNTFDKIAINPYNNEFDIKPYKSKISNQYRLRVGKYRFIYQVKDDILFIFISDAGSRGSIY
ncbi:MAG: type II toxin-antitoxin system RelE/ParE family toxin [Campylobacterota bacterium]|nr:type II toxin-antitoxin system RelE/ParE family toxin [Campylobacterota bacterium]